MEGDVGKNDTNLKAESRRHLSCLSEQVAAGSRQIIPI